jgi:hypothetical protein
MLDFCETQREWTRELLERLARLDSPSHDRAVVNRCGALTGILRRPLVFRD